MKIALVAVAETVRDLEVQLKNVKVRCRSIKKNK
jgi:hypothetical protein